jgi:hypothetical protein
LRGKPLTMKRYPGGGVLFREKCAQASSRVDSNGADLELRQQTKRQLHPGK